MICEEKKQLALKVVEDSDVKAHLQYYIEEDVVISLKDSNMLTENECETIFNDKEILDFIKKGWISQLSQEFD